MKGDLLGATVERKTSDILKVVRGKGMLSERIFRAERERKGLQRSRTVFLQSNFDTEPQAEIQKQGEPKATDREDVDW